MKQPAKYWTASVGLDAFVLGMFYLWWIEGIDRAGAVFQFACWALTIIMLLGALGIDRDHVVKNPRPKGFGIYHFVSEIAILVALVWADMMILAAVRICAVFIFESALNVARKKAA